LLIEAQVAPRSPYRNARHAVFFKFLLPTQLAMSKAATFHNPDLRFDYYIIVPHPRRPAILMLSGEHGWSLPHFVSEEHHYGVIGHISKTVSSNLGLAVTVRRCVYDAYDQEANTVNAVYLLENHFERWEAHDGAAWVSRDELGKLRLQSQEHRATLDEWFDEVVVLRIPSSALARWRRTRITYREFRTSHCICETPTLRNGRALAQSGS
jgi:hypothetical protein